MRVPAALLSSAVFLSLTQPVSAQTPTSNRADFACTMTWYTGTLTNRPACGTTVTVTSNSSPEYRTAGVAWGGGFTDGDGLLFGWGSKYYQFDFASAIGGFGTQEWFNYGTGGSIVFSTFLGGAAKGSWTYATGGGAAPNANQATFFGVLDDGGFDRVIIRAQRTGPEEFAINQVGINPTVVPEPASMMLLGTGLLGVFAVARRRNRNVG